MGSTTTQDAELGLGAARRSRWRSGSPDALIVASLLVTAFLARRNGLPDDGLWHDDAWVAAGAVRGEFSQLLSVGSGHPGFTGALMLWRRLTGGASASMAYPALVTGTLAPPLLYLVLRRLGFAASIGALMGAALVVADVHVLYSGRVKTYAIDVLIVLGVTIVIPVLAGRRWAWGIAAGWIAAAVVVGSFSGFALVATAAAGVLLIVHAASDRWVRVAAVAVQGAAQLALLREMRRRSDLETIERQQENLYDGHIDFEPNPLEFGADVVDHLRRIATVFPGGSGGWLTAFVLIALSGLLVAAIIGPRRTAARFLVLIFGLAFVGGVLDRFPFGPGGGLPFSRGERSTLWLVPVMAVGLAASLDVVRRFAAPRVVLRIGFDALMLGLALAVLVSQLKDAPEYPFPGSKPATEFVDAQLRDDDLVLIAQTSIFPFAVETESDVRLRARPETDIGYAARFPDPRLQPVGGVANLAGTPDEIRALLTGVERVFVFLALPFFAGAPLDTIEATLRAEGFENAATERFEDALVVLWRRV